MAPTSTAKHVFQSSFFHKKSKHLDIDKCISRWLFTLFFRNLRESFPIKVWTWTAEVARSETSAFFLVQRKWNRVRCLRIRAVRVVCAGAERFPPSPSVPAIGMNTSVIMSMGSAALPSVCRLLSATPGAHWSLRQQLLGRRFCSAPEVEISRKNQVLASHPRSGRKCGKQR